MRTASVAPVVTAQSVTATYEGARETVRDGDPAWVGPLAGVQLGLPVLHVFEDEVKAQADPATYEAEIGFFAMTLDVEEVTKAMKRARGEE